MQNVPNAAYRAYGQTDRGLVRANNDDSFYVSLAHGIFAVADGLGGLPEGALASRSAIEELETMVNQLPPGAPLDLGVLFAAANERVRSEGTRVGAELGIGTTLTVAQLLPGEVLRIGHVGDSGVVAFGDDEVAKLTDDHTMASELLSRLHPDEHAYIPEYFEHTLTRCLGQNEPLSADVFEYRLVRGERFMLYTDGVPKVVGFAELRELTMKASKPETLVEELIVIGNERGGPDNLTAVAVFLS
ncbi:MAG: PP2C family protein-serine/threonine phosphatase [Opitutales bacterium]